MHNQQWDGRRGQHLPYHPAEQVFTQARIAMGTHDQRVRMNGRIITDRPRRYRQGARCRPVRLAGKGYRFAQTSRKTRRIKPISGWMAADGRACPANHRALAFHSLAPVIRAGKRCHRRTSASAKVWIERPLATSRIHEECMKFEWAIHCKQVANVKFPKVHQRLENWKLLRAFALPYFLRSTWRSSRVR